MAPLVSVDGVAKRYCRDARRSLAYGVRDIWSEILPRRPKQPALRKGEFWALRDVGCVVERGEALAVVGPNGSGKTTLTRLVAGILKPDVGDIVLGGSVSGVIELGGGLDPLLTGRENAAMGLRWRGVESALLPKLIADIQDFAELTDEFDAPVQTYSSGMRSRLGFAITTRVPCDLLLLDEVLAVGDIRFQRKCLRYIRQHLNGGGGMMFVSHNIYQVQTVCTRALVLDQGRVAYDGDVVPALERLFEVQAETPAELRRRVMRRSHPCIVGVEVAGGDQREVRTRAPMTIELKLATPHAVRAQCIVSIWSRDLAVCIADMADPASIELPPGESRRICRIPHIPLSAGTYAVRAVIMDPETNHPWAMFGYEDSPIWIKVGTEEDRGAPAGAIGGRLVEIDNSWATG